MDRRGFLKLAGGIGGGLLIPDVAMTAVKGKTYYVSGAGHDSNNGLSVTGAFRTLQRASDISSPGDVIYVLNGEYTKASSYSSVVRVTRSGSAGAYISYRNYPGHSPRVIVGPHNWNAFGIYASYVLVEGFEVAGNAAAITYNYAYSQRGNPSNPAVNAKGICAGGSGGTIRNITIRKNFVHHLPGNGISVNSADYVTINENVVQSCAWWNNYGGSAISVYGARHVNVSMSGYKIRICRNICHDNVNFIPSYYTGAITDGNGIIVDDNKNTQQSGIAAYVGRTLVDSNLCFNNGGAGLHVYSSSTVDCVHNTAYFNNRSPSINTGEVTAEDSTAVRFHNNIFYARTGRRCQSHWGNVGVNYNFNIFYNGAYSVKGPNDIIANPRFVHAAIDLGSANFQLASGSLAVATGTTDLATAFDITGKSRALTPGICRGAYEF